MLHLSREEQIKKLCLLAKSRAEVNKHLTKKGLKKSTETEYKFHMRNAVDNVRFKLHIMQKFAYSN